MKKQRLNIVIPSRTQGKQVFFLERAVASVRHQTVIDKFDLNFLVGVDAGKIPRGGDIGSRLEITFIESHGNSQAAALNAAIRNVNADFVAFLEDDDQWYPRYLEFAMQAISSADFVSSTQIEYDEKGELLRINDFPTPSGWFMPASTLKQVGEFNESFRFHLDNEWLGRLAETKLKRFHMVESTAPIKKEFISSVRPWLGYALDLSGGYCQIMRHHSPYPLVKRLVHSGSGMAQIAENKSFQEISRREQEILVNRFGRIPW